MTPLSRCASAIAAVALLACNDQTGRTHQATRSDAPTLQGAPLAPPSANAPGLPAFAIRGLETRSVLEVPPSEMRLALANTYRVRPDRRFLGAVAEVHRLLSGKSIDTVKATFRNGTWTIEYAGEHVGDLPELPGFEDARTVLAGWSARLLQRYPLDSTASAAAAEELARAHELLTRVRPVEIASGLKTVDEAWSRARGRDWLVPASRGLVLLTLQVPPLDVVGDPIAARALAVSVVAHAAGVGDSVAAAVTLLADYMGYSVESAQLAGRLARGDPAGLYVRRDTAGLRAASGSLPRFLYLAQLTRRGGGEAWESWMSNVASREAADHDDDHHDPPLDTAAITSGVLGRGLDFIRFAADQTVPHHVSKQLGVELQALAARQGRAVSGVAEWGNVLLGPTDAGRKLARFEDDLAVVAGGFRGAFLDSVLVGTYFRAQMHQGFERACIHLVDGRESAEHALDFAKQFTSAPAGLWAESARWCLHHARVLAGASDGQESIADARDVTSMSTAALRHLLDDMERAFTFDGPVELDAARAVFSRLDTRPAELYWAGATARRVLSDLPLADRYHERVLALAAGEYEKLAVRHAFHVRDLQALRRLAADPRLDRDTRFDALRSLLVRGDDSAFVHARFRDLIAEPGCPWSMRDDYIRQVLEPAERFEDAARVAREWLDAHPQDRSFDAVYARTALARQYQWLGRPLEAWRIISPLRRTHQLGVLQRSALIAVDLGDSAVADSLTRALARAYGDVDNGREALAQIHWARSDYAAAAEQLRDPDSVFPDGAWSATLAPSFVRAFAKRPVSDAVRAMTALVAAGVDPLTLAAVPRAAAKAGRDEMAAALGELLAEHGHPRIFYPKVYRYISNARGDSAALKWIAARWPPPQGLIAGADAFRFREFDLLWTLTTSPDPGSGDGSFIWLMRALGELQQTAPRPERQRALLRHYRSAGAGAYDLAGRYLMGLEPEAKIVALATSPKRRVEYSFYLGIKALSERRYRDASDWLRVTVETRQTRDGEFLWAKDLLSEWVGTGKALPEAAREVGSRQARAAAW